MTTPDAGQRLIEDLREGIVSKKLFDAAADLIERLRGVEADARRYRWLREGAWREAKPDPGVIRLDVVLYQGDWPGDQSAMDDFDMAIDAAIAASRSTGAADMGEEK